MFGRMYNVFSAEDFEDFNKNDMEYILLFFSDNEEIAQAFSGDDDECVFFTNKRIIFFKPDEGNSMFNDCKVKFVHYSSIHSYTVNGSTQDDRETIWLEIKFIDDEACRFFYNKDFQAEYTAKLIGGHI